MLFLMNLSIYLALIFIFLTHPLSLGMILLLQTIIISLITGMMSFNYLFSYILFLIMIGGMLILFIYMTSIASNEKFKFSMNLTIMFFFIFTLFLLMMLFDSFFMTNSSINELINQPHSHYFPYTLNKFINWPMNFIFFMMIIYLLITLIMVVKITNINYGPLRQKF
uniref:NADH-ubiquinone oxidoreductase chain 6 n=1 Tax=Oberea yaoshana TaxID=2604360 RepID=A0A5B9RI20_9CUCU|nr:NADH dehydrogenase subunit 6 [Oberea yaoshana]